MAIDFDRVIHAWLGKPEILIGVATAVAGCAWLLAIAIRNARIQPPDNPRPSSSRRLNLAWMTLLALAIVVGGAVRLFDLDVKGLSHPEIFIPGINLPVDISIPTPRHAFVETAVWHFYYEPHPVGYYLSMWAWTRTFGTSVTSLRVPAVLLGTLSIFLIYLVAARTYTPRVGVVAASLLALHGMHIFWSQIARMYVPGAFLGLLSTWLLLEISRAQRPRVGLEAAYVLTTLAGALTVEFFWPLLAVQILWTALNQQRSSPRLPRTAVVQTLAFVLSSPALSHAAMLGRDELAPPPTLSFLREYFSFAFLFQPGANPKSALAFPMAASLTILAASLVLLVLGLRARTTETISEDAAPAALGPLLFCAAGITLVMLGIAGISYGRRPALAVLSVLPLVTVLVCFAPVGLRPALKRGVPAVEGWLQRHRTATALVPLLAVVPTLVMFAASYAVTLTAPRAFLIFVPYFLIVVAAGIVAISRWHLVTAAVVIFLGVLFSASAVFMHGTPVSPRDYKGLARAINARMQPGDLIFTRVNWAYTPIYYYLDRHRLVGLDFEQAINRAPRSRVWVLSFRNERPGGGEVRALSHHQLVGSVHALEASAFLYVPSPDGSSAELAAHPRP